MAGLLWGVGHERLANLYRPAIVGLAFYFSNVDSGFLPGIATACTKHFATNLERLGQDLCD